MEKSSIEWGHWQPDRTIEVWKAVLLSVGIDPDSNELNLEDTLATHPEVKRRMERLLTDLNTSGLLNDVTTNDADPKSTLVILEQLAAWCIQSHPPLGYMPAQFFHLGERIVHERQEAQKSRDGRYTLEEAAEMLETIAGERLPVILGKLKDAALRGSLPVYSPGSKLRYEYDPGEAPDVREFHEEVYWSDLNSWLEQNEPQILFRFPKPEVEQERGSGDTTPSSSPVLPGAGNNRPIPRQEFQESEILRIIRDLGYEPTALPKNKPGKPGVKAEVRKKLKFEGTVLEKAWERLRRQGRIANK